MEIQLFGFGTYDKWSQKLQNFPNHIIDIYYTPEYYLNWQYYFESEPFCFYFEQDGFEILYPFFKKEIKGFDIQPTIYDIQTAYGYGGAITNQQEIPKQIADNFNQQFDNWCKINNVIAEFIRLDPLQNPCPRKANKIPIRFNSIADLEHYQFKNNAKKDFKAAINKKLKVSIDTDLKTMDHFVNLYQLTAERIEMDDFYKFDQIYFNEFIQHLKGKAVLINILYNSKIIVSKLLFSWGMKFHSHLTASDFEYKKLNGNDLVYKAATEYAISKGAKLLSFGGGTTHSLDDSLLKFKQKYGTLTKEVFIGTNIHLNEIYNDLINQWGHKHPELMEKYKHYFLKYRFSD